jgi:predicted transcriptional regulator
MAQNGQRAQRESSLLKLLQRRRLSVSALARKIRRPRTSVSRAIHQGIFPELQKEIREALKAS